MLPWKHGVPRSPEYKLCDKAYSRLIDQLSAREFDHLTPDLRQNILAFYAKPPAPGKKHPKLCHKTKTELAIIEAAPAASGGSTRP